MSRLLSAEFQRLFKSLCFRIYIILAAVNCLPVVLLYSPELYDISENAFAAISFMTIAGAVFTGMFIGREYSDGTIRNKLTVGHKRVSIYLSSLIVCTAANMLAIAVNLTVMFGLAIPIVGTSMPFDNIVFFSLLSLAPCAAFTAISVFMAMLVSSKAASTALLVLMVFFLFFVASFIDSRLNEPEYYSSYEITVSEDGVPQYQQGESMKNPFYISGNTRKVFEVLNDVLPSSQMYHIVSAQQAKDLSYLAVYDVMILIVFSAAGIPLFRKKTLK